MCLELLGSLSRFTSLEPADDAPGRRRTALGPPSHSRRALVALEPLRHDARQAVRLGRPSLAHLSHRCLRSCFRCTPTATLPSQPHPPSCSVYCSPSAIPRPQTPGPRPCGGHVELQRDFQSILELVLRC
ncbi:hypothetical protein FA09DRAFT_56858 [Tilletiopsis washingtonensis]|uniref:Uncharacterized protein n=1 Tax=Tilletiopsis washingtonensis TaxID=58919 RepID=A0A316ZB66_9BASI|nr:hypothetical protein FA09DRAFT_56858 [Tilletiopsis washingtonensis]PWN97505.1 hypothetical protein FA09DRAFT_56858 [Tilletiopsis washingtonensis]